MARTLSPCPKCGVVWTPRLVWSLGNLLRLFANVHMRGTLGFPEFNVCYRCPKCRHVVVPRIARDSTIRCHKCDYDLTGNESGRCPECGWKIPEPIRLKIVVPRGPQRCAVFVQQSNSDSQPFVHKAVHADALSIQQLVNGIFGEYGLAIAVDGVDEHLAEPAEYFHARGGEFWVVEDGGQIVATVGALPHDRESVELKALYVHPSIRRQGWGRRLTLLVMDYARTKGKKRVILWSDTRFTDAHRLYRQLGFRQSSERDLHDIYNSSEYGFECELTAVPE